MSRAGVLLLCSLLGVWLGGCGEETPDDQAAVGSTSTPEASVSPSQSDVPDGPACAEVWVDGQAIPGSYKGCVDGDAWVDAEATRCDSGQVLIVYGDRYYGAKGAVVNDVGTSLQESDQYRRAVRACG
ncbi:hypothetical protein [Nocardioides sp.]|uniref:hypothetical protein n=1 Tax=Nocardioides sp. TaxID=35761 RepID=UPI002ED434CF